MTNNTLLLQAITCTSLDALTTLIATYLDQTILIIDDHGHVISASTTNLPPLTADWVHPDMTKGVFTAGRTEYLRRPINTFALNTWYLFVSQPTGYPVTADQLTLVIQIINQFNERYTVNPNQSEMNSLFAQLIKAPTTTDTTAFNRLLKQPLVAISATAMVQHPEQTAFKAALQKALPTMPMTEDRQQNLVLVAPTTTVDFELTTLTTIAKRYHYCIFISEPFTDLTKTGEFLSICRQAFQASQQLGQLQPVNLTQRYNIYIILNHMDDLNLLRNTMCTQLLTLRRHDQQHHTELFQTLYTYLEHDCRLSITAEQLHLHRNSLTKRLQRIDELIHLNLDQPQRTFGLRLSYRIFHYLNY